MMLLQQSNFCVIPSSQFPSLKQRNPLLHRQKNSFNFPRKAKASTFRISSLGAGFFNDFAQIADNKDSTDFHVQGGLHEPNLESHIGSHEPDVLIAAVVSMAIGQLSKPFTSVFLYGKEFDVKALVQAGGFPSSHSSATVACATLLGLERGLSDPIFGLALVYAGLVMYDAQDLTVLRINPQFASQTIRGILTMVFDLICKHKSTSEEGGGGRSPAAVDDLCSGNGPRGEGVRREVGIHARTMNKLLLQLHINYLHSKHKEALINSQSGSSNPPKVGHEKSLLSQETTANAFVAVKSEGKIRQSDEELLSSDLFLEDAKEISKLVADGFLPLKESVGHTEVEVVAGGLLGFLVALAVYNFK
ncbi:hypothetical protein TSUD_279540 [Trifolium subterraneum]|uniref:Uncharacterized protein n=1 Tax=Trifolium subterraneum TaxID=3900 RepID=A0A2Z6NAM2_TRISU|nr:hypothetical protein TSUD_279540 [Trifolium subterraneum]